MICGHCGDETAEAPCGRCGEDPILEGRQGRYRLDAILGRGGGGVTYRATRLGDGVAVCVKELSFHRIQSFDAEKLFRREADVLRHLAHPRIPAYIDDFAAGSGKTLSLYLVQELVDGRSLAQEMADRRYTEAEVLEMLDALLEILEYLQALRPPVIHRDIKPSNVMRRASDGELVLVDFGSVKDVAKDATLGGSTVAGTFGFMAPEQLYGKANEATDLYGLAVLGVVLLSRRDPSELLDESHQLAWRPHVQARSEVLAWLDHLLQRDPAARPANARAARKLLRQLLGGQAAPLPALTLRAAPSPPAESYINPKAALAVVGLLSLMMMALVLVMSSPPDSVGVADLPPLPDVQCAGACDPLSDPFKDRLTFGMTQTEATDARADLAKATLGEVSGPHTLIGLGGFYGEEAPGQKLTARMTLAREPATCELFFTDAGGLGRISCTADKHPDEGSHRGAEAKVLRALMEKYGPPTDRTHSDPGFQHEATYTWRSGEGELKLESEFSDMMFVTSKLTLTQRTQAYAAAVERAIREAEARAEADKRARAASEAEKRRLEAERLRALGEGDGL